MACDDTKTLGFNFLDRLVHDDALPLLRLRDRHWRDIARKCRRLATGCPAAADPAVVTAYAASAAGAAVHAAAVPAAAPHHRSPARVVDRLRSAHLAERHFSRTRRRGQRGRHRQLLKTEKHRPCQRQAKKLIFHIRVPLRNFTQIETTIAGPMFARSVLITRWRSICDRAFFGSPLIRRCDRLFFCKAKYSEPDFQLAHKNKTCTFGVVCKSVIPMK